ncbi:MAG: hypothetical protein ABJJ05_06770 [Maribacter litoralis]|uniref:hypothetical protein n=1 Tax=Maribacter litoralis TaxID=2059726 RepID=UPI003297AB02
MNNNTAPLAADSYFFKELISGDVQTANQAFGPVVGSEQTQYRATSKFTTAGDVKAYAICTGQVFIQPHSDTNKINLILRPYRQPMKGVAIKYFIYRGLKKIDFIPSGDTILVGHSQLSTATGFIQTIWNQLKGFNGWTNTEANANDFLAKWIGYDPTNQPDTSLIDDYFFMADAYGDENNETLKPFEFPMISKGTHLGNFIGDYGLDVVLSDGDYKALKSNTGFLFDLAYARAAETVIDTTLLPSGYAEKQYREAITWFMDAAAYYGLHFSEKGKVFTMNGTNEEKKTGQTLYDEIVAQFSTKNNVYLHIQGHLARSYNYYESYSNLVENDEVLKIGVAEDAMATSTYPENGWPVVIQNTAQAHSNETNDIFLQMAHDQTNTLLAYGQVGILSDKAENNFLTEVQLRPETTVDQYGVTAVDSYCKPIGIVVPAIEDNSDKLNVASYLKLLYIGNQLTVLEDANGTPEEKVIKPIDTLFGPINILQRMAQANEDVVSVCFSTKTGLFETKRIDSNGPDNDIVSQTRIIHNKLAFLQNSEISLRNTILYETDLLNGSGESIYLRNSPGTVGAMAKSYPFVKEENNSYQLDKPLFFRTKRFTDYNISVNGVQIKSTIRDYPNKFILGLESSENDQLISLIQNNGAINTSVFLIPFLSEESPFVSLENIRYYKFQIGVLGEASSGILELYKLEDAFSVYSLDQALYFTSKFSEFVQDGLADILLENVTIDKTL